MECGRSSGVEHNLAKVRVVSSNLIARSSFNDQKDRALARSFAFQGRACKGQAAFPFAAGTGRSGLHLDRKGMNARHDVAKRAVNQAVTFDSA